MYRALHKNKYRRSTDADAVFSQNSICDRNSDQFEDWLYKNFYFRSRNSGAIEAESHVFTFFDKVAKPDLCSNTH